VLKPGESAEGTITLYNPTDETIVVERIETSCECVTLGESQFRIQAHASIPLLAAFRGDLASSYAGSLRVNIRAFGSTRNQLFESLLVADLGGGRSNNRDLEKLSNQGSVR
jgi:hypothetical protein